jgi:hypothetical protein
MDCRGATNDDGLCKTKEHTEPNEHIRVIEEIKTKQLRCSIPKKKTKVSADGW